MYHDTQKNEICDNAKYCKIMSIEIERKFLLKVFPEDVKSPGVHMRQAYLSTGPPATIRIRITTNLALITLKQATKGLARYEFEYPVPLHDAETMLNNHMYLGNIIEKTRYEATYAGLVWEIDIFAGSNEGLKIVEVELKSEDQKVILPPWVGMEVTGDPRYYNANLARQPYCEW